MAMRMAKNLSDYTYGSQTKASYGPTGSSGVIRQLGLIASVPWLGSYGGCCQNFMTNRFSKIFKNVQTRVQSRTVGNTRDEPCGGVSPIEMRANRVHCRRIHACTKARVTYSGA
jgi:hypothetical protein